MLDQFQTHGNAIVIAHHFMENGSIIAQIVVPNKVMDIVLLNAIGDEVANMYIPWHYGHELNIESALYHGWKSFEKDLEAIRELVLEVRPDWN